MSSLTGTLDKSLPVPVGTQLFGLIQFGIALGELVAGFRLPSVRDLASHLGIAPMTVSTVYADLRKIGLIEARPGSGTFVASLVKEDRGRASAMRKVQKKVDALFAEAESMGLAPADIAALVSARVARGRAVQERPLSLVMVGNFIETTTVYAERVTAYLGLSDTITVTTFSALQEGAQFPQPADICLTHANRRGEVEAFAPQGVPVVGLSYIPSEETRARLASLDPEAHVCVVSVFAEFMALMKPGVLRFAPHVAEIDVRMIDDPALEQVLNWADVVIYASGLETTLLPRLPEGRDVFEYRHVPDPHSIRTTLLPVLERLRAGLPHQEEAL
ncbi:GntR family transcriptional regulator [Lacibacterium aquatile]|uniref:GntR family transcriptional regulator n=1 Tax=Lacibacterium aquatile TaxID=1168082 RepID=A0ABW5DLI0_9PROT